LAVAEGLDLASAAAGTEGYSGAELEAVLLVASGLAADAQRKITGADLQAAVADVIPSRDSRMLAFMEMLAVFESSSQRMLPARFQGLSTEDVQARLDELALQLGGRVRR